MISEKVQQKENLLCTDSSLGYDHIWSRVWNIIYTHSHKHKHIYELLDKLSRANVHGVFVVMWSRICLD